MPQLMCVVTVGLAWQTSVNTNLNKASVADLAQHRLNESNFKYKWSSEGTEGNTLVDKWSDTLLFKWKLFETEKHEYLHASVLNMSVQKFNVARWIPNFTSNMKTTKLNS